jgi:Txe/YoeB family toxin of Txe-Axe toxin-antitoxin module
VNIASGGLEGLVEMYPLLDTVGDVTDVALQGTLLYYQGIPSTVQDLVVLYYEDVNVLEADDDTPDYLPEYLHIRLLSNHAAWQEYSKIEDGIEGIQVNVVKYKNLYEEAKGQFQEWLARRRNHTHRSVWDK